MDPYGMPMARLRVNVRYPLDLSALDDFASTSISSAHELLAAEIEEMKADPTFLLELMASSEADVAYEFELEATDLLEEGEGYVEDPRVITNSTELEELLRRHTYGDNLDDEDLGL